jgi:hypothetical protein
MASGLIAVRHHTSYSWEARNIARREIVYPEIEREILACRIMDVGVGCARVSNIARDARLA